MKYFEFDKKNKELMVLLYGGKPTCNYKLIFEADRGKERR